VLTKFSENHKLLKFTHLRWSGDTPWKKTLVLLGLTLSSTHLAHVFKPFSYATKRSMSLYVWFPSRMKSHLQKEKSEVPNQTACVIILGLIIIIMSVFCVRLFSSDVKPPMPRVEYEYIISFPVFSIFNRIQFQDSTNAFTCNIHQKRVTWKLHLHIIHLHIWQRKT